MALELVTSKTGSFHVDSVDDRLLHARTMGGGNYVLYGCECTMKTANKLHIAEGEMLLQGGFVRITNGGEDVTITNGAQGRKRNTLVCFDWKKGAQDIETTSLVAINGANTTGTPADPSYVDGDMNSGDTHVQIPICRIALNGLTVGDPVVLLDDFQPVADLRETISPIMGIAFRAARSLEMPSAGRWGIGNFDFMAGIDPGDVMYVSVEISTCQTSSEGVYARWNTNDGRNDIEIISPISQCIYINVLTMYSVAG